MKNFFKDKNILILILILIGAFVIRILNIGFETGSHPDERAIIMISEGVFNNHFNPKNFHYGSFIFYLLWATSWFFEFLVGVVERSSSLNFCKDAILPALRFLSSYDGAFYIGRTYACIAGTITVLFTYLLSSKMFNKKVGLLSAFLLATNPFHISLSRYYTTDIFVTCFSVMVAFFLYEAIVRNSYKNYIFSIICFALGFVFKISMTIMALPIGVTSIYLLIRNKNYKNSFSYIKFFLYPALIVFGIIFLLEPFFFFDFSSFIGDNRSQVEMVRGRWMPPYTRQYLNTLPFLYYIGQMFNYTIRPIVFTLSIFGLIWLIIDKEFAKLNKNILWFFILPSFLIMGSYFVKFPRYLLLIYPFLLILAGYALYKLKSKILTVIICTLSFIIAIDSISIYFNEHSYRTVSRWIYENIPPESTILGVHWDDKIPLLLPGIDSNKYKYKYHNDEYDLKLYEESNEQNLTDYINMLLKGDYIALPADRIFRGILDKFDQKREYSIKILQGLFDGSLGFVPAYIYKPRSFLAARGFYNDDLADESLVGYDHPKAFVFKKVKNLTFEELKSNIENQPLKISLKKVLSTKNFSLAKDDKELRLNIDGKIFNPIQKKSFKGIHLKMNSFFAIILWLIIIDISSFYILPIIFVTCTKLPDKGLGIFRLVGLGVFAFIMWILGSVFKVEYTQVNLILILLCLYVSSFLILKVGNVSISSFISSVCNKKLLKIEYTYFGVFLVFAIFKLLSPEIVFGEKTMDLGFLNYFSRTTSLPPSDPWSIDNQMSYYFFGYFIFGLVHKLSSFPTAFGYNLTIATIAGILTTTLISLIFYLKKSLKVSVLFSLAIVLLTNFEKFYMYFFDTRKSWQLGFDLFWKTARVHEFYSNAITEYPFWSLIFSDLHPHVMAMPFFVCVLLFFIYLYKEKSVTPLFYILMSCISVVLLMTNTWDVITMSFLGIVFLLTVFISNFKEGISLLKKLLIFGCLSLIFVCPFYIFCLSGNKSSTGWVQTSEFHGWFHVFRHFGFWLFPILWGFFTSFKILKNTSYKRIIINLILSSIPFVVASFSIFQDVSWGIQIISFFLLFIGLTYMKEEDHFLSSIFLITFSILLSLTELFFFIDRPNTIFKIYIGMWFFVSLSSVQFVKDNFKNWYFKWTFFVLLGICIVSSCISYVAMARFSHIRNEKVSPTLNGVAFLKNQNKDLFNVVNWINKNIKGTPILLETYGPSYYIDTSIPYQKYTGLPILHGWDHHVKQRGTSEENLSQKKKDIDEFYKTFDKEKIKSLLEKYNIDLVAVGKKENEKYPKESLDKFSQYDDIFVLLTSSNNEALYLVKDKLSGVSLDFNKR